MRLLLIGALVCATACSPQMQVAKPAHEPLPQVALRDDSLLAADGTVLPLRSWLPKGKPRAVIIALHGFNDYSNAFTGAGEFFKKRGVALVAYDQRGFGKTAHTGIWPGDENLTRDLAQAVVQAQRRWPGAPVYLLGESMGGAVAIIALADPAFPRVRGLILSAPAVWGDEAMSPLFRSTLWLGAHTFPDMRFTGSDLKILASNNIPMLRRLSADPLVIKNTRVDAVYGLVHLMGEAYAKVPQVATPTLLLYGDEDQVIPSGAVHSAAERFTAPLQTMWYPDGYHMLLRDMQAEQVMRDIERWMR